MNGARLLINPGYDGKIFLTTSADGEDKKKRICETVRGQGGSQEFAKFEGGGILVEVKKRRRKGHTFYGVTSVTLPLGVDLQIERYADHLNIILNMQQLLEGQDGHCGNFNGDSQDDTDAAIKARMGEVVVGEDEMFDDKAANIVGCYGKNDIATWKKKGNVFDLQECSKLCTNHKFFGRRGSGECYCGDEIDTKYRWFEGKQPDAYCKCDEHEGATLKSGSCIYTYADGSDASQTKLSDCAPAKLQGARSKCKAAMGPETEANKDDFQGCIVDVCFAGDRFAEEAEDFFEVEQKAEAKVDIANEKLKQR